MAVKQIVSSYKRKFNRPHKVTEWDSSDNKPQRKTTWKVDETSLYTFRKNSYLRQKHGGSIVLILEKFDNQFVFVLFESSTNTKGQFFYFVHFMSKYFVLCLCILLIKYISKYKK
jgi:hypothetical protein